jgi:arylformamidase
MTFVDLSHDIHENMPVFPGMSLPKLEKPFKVKIHGYAETLITLLSHTGTHMDAPAHMHEYGKTLDSYEVKSFIGNGIVLDAQGKMEIDLKTVKSIENQIKVIDFVLFCTGWSNFWGSDTYFTGFPALSLDAAIWLASSGIKGIGLDCISADIAESTDFPVHHALFDKNLLIVENLKNLYKLTGKTFMFSCLPLKYADSDGSPVRAVAWF